MLSDADVDTFPMTRIASKVAEIIEACLLDPEEPGLGGRALVGPEQLMKVFVSGRPWPRHHNQTGNGAIADSAVMGPLLQRLRAPNGLHTS